MIQSPGKFRGLQTTSNAHNIFTILALDHGVSLAQTINPSAPECVTYADMVDIKTRLLHHLAPHASAVLLDPVTGLGPAVLGGALPGHVGLLLEVEDGDYANTESPMRLFEGWSVAQIKQVGGAAVKCFFYYHPDHRELAEQQEKAVAALVEDCVTYDLPLFAEPISYGIQPTERCRVVVESAQRIAQLSVDILKVEFPVDVNHESDESAWLDACQMLNDTCPVPWAILSAGVDFDTFARQVRVACQAGASGYLAGRAIWKEAVTLSGEEQSEFLKNVAAARLHQLAQIATEYGRPWTDVYPYQTEPSPRGWYQSI